MAEPGSRTYSHKELAEILVRHAGIKDGHWAVSVEFGLGAANLPVADAGGTFSLKPAALVPINTIGIREYTEPNPLTVNAAEVNPAAKSSPKKKMKKTPDT